MTSSRSDSPGGHRNSVFPKILGRPVIGRSFEIRRTLVGIWYDFARNLRGVGLEGITACSASLGGTTAISQKELLGMIRNYSELLDLYSELLGISRNYLGLLWNDEGIITNYKGLLGNH